MFYKKSIAFTLKGFTFCLLLFSYHLTLAGSDSLLYEETPSYSEVIIKYRQLDSLSQYARLIPYGETDGGQTIHLFVISKNAIFDPSRLRESGKTILLITNGIHPGEPDGINASILLSEKLLADEGKLLPENVAICIIPILNIEGALERGCCSRVNQNGPPLYGFRANGQNLDLNRDFVKVDSDNILSWIKIFQQWDPEILIDTHVSDGADYQYTMTLISSQHNKMYATQGDYMNKVLSPALYSKMKEAKMEMSPYVETFKWNLPPDSGITAFLETPRFLSGYAALFNTFGFISESHMLKPFPDRVHSTLTLLNCLVDICEEKHVEINLKKAQARKENQFRSSFPINWQLDTSKFERISFKGYEHSYKPSNVTGLNRLHYDREKPFNKKLPYYNYYIPQDTINAPLYYLIPQAWNNVVQRLHASNIRILTVREDSIAKVEVYYIDKYETTDNPYEGHYLHSSTKVRMVEESIQVYKGDYLVPVFQPGSRYVVETLEPISVDSYFNWGFFDAILQQKEWFSAYAFEEIAEEILAENELLRNQFQDRRRNDPEFAQNSFAQLYFIYKNSKYFEKSLMRYPVYRIGSMQSVSREN